MFSLPYYFYIGLDITIIIANIHVQGDCKAWIKSEYEDGVFPRNGDAKHNHPPEPDEKLLLRDVNACVDAATLDCQRYRIVFDVVRRE